MLCRISVFVLVVVVVVLAGTGVVAADGPPDDAPLCGVPEESPDDCICSESRYNAGLAQPEDCWCPVPYGETSSWCSDWPNVRLWFMDAPVTPGPVFLTATPVSYREVFPPDPRGCPDWSYLGDGTATPHADDVSPDYAAQCASCLAGSAGLLLPTPVTGAIHTPLPGVSTAVPGEDWYLASDVEPGVLVGVSYDFSSSDTGLVYHVPWQGWLLGRDVVGAVVEWQVVSGAECDVKVESRSSGWEYSIAVDEFWLTPGRHCVADGVVCDALELSQAARSQRLYGYSVQVPLLFGPRYCAGRYKLVVDWILRDHKGGGVAVPGVPTPTPVVTVTPTPQVQDFWAGEPVGFSGSLFDGAASVSCRLDGAVRWYRVGKDFLGWTYELVDIPGVLVGVILKVDAVGKFKRMDNSDCRGAASLWPDTSELIGSVGFACWSFDYAGLQGQQICELMRSRLGIAQFVNSGWMRMLASWAMPRAAGSDVSVGFETQWRAYGDYHVTFMPIYYGQPVFPTATPAVFPTATPDWSGPKACNVVEWRRDKSGEDFLSWDWDALLSEKDCYVLFDGVDKSIDLSRIPLLELPDIDFHLPGFQLCVRWLHFPEVSLLGFEISLDWFLLPVVMGFLGWFIRS